MPTVTSTDTSNTKKTRFQRAKALAGKAAGMVTPTGIFNLASTLGSSAEESCDFIEKDDNEVAQELIPNDQDSNPWLEVSKLTQDKPTALQATEIGTSNFSYKYAPTVRPVTGTKSLCCIILRWDGKKNVPTLGQAFTMGRATAQIYRDLSGGKYTFNVTAKSVEVDYPFLRRKLNAAENQAKRKVGKYDFYAIVHSNVREYSNAGGNTAHLRSTLTATCCHELGHLLTLEHSGKFVNGKYEEYGDGLCSFMSAFPKKVIAAPQLYHLGWLKQTQVALYEQGTTQSFDIEPLYAENPDSPYLKAVMIPGNDKGKDIFISAVPMDGKFIFAAHLRNRGGSQRISTFNKHAEFKDMVLDREQFGGYARLTIRPKA